MKQAEPAMKVAVIGAGYVGLCTGAGLAAAGHDVTCVDLDELRVNTLNQGIAPFHEPGLEELLREPLRAGRFRATTDAELALDGTQVSFIAVGTPSRSGAIDLSQVESAAATIGKRLPTLPEGHTVVVKSTVVPGTAECVVGPALVRHSGLPRDAFGLASNPEFLREGSAVADFMDPDRIVIGAADDRAAATLLELYAPFDCPKPRMSTSEAELSKYASNSLLATLVSFSNEIARFCEALPGADVATVLGSLQLDRRLSPRENGRTVTPQILGYLGAGCGYGGSCLPKDVDALRGAAAERGVPTPLLDAVVRVNSGRPEDLVALLGEEIGVLHGSEIAVLGLAFKPGTDDLRDSPALRVIDLLRQDGAKVRAFDPLVTDDPRRQTGARVCKSLEEAVTGAAAAVLVTACPEFRDADWSALAGHMSEPVLVDGRSLLRGAALPPALRYRSIGVGPEVCA